MVEITDSSYSKYKSFADKYHSSIKKIIKQIFYEQTRIFNIEVEITTESIDINESTDYQIIIPNGRFSARIRKIKYFLKYKDWTIRSRVKSGNKTELDKLKEGASRWYFYGWGTKRYNIPKWVFLDLEEVRKKGIFDKKRSEISNGDGSWFIAIPIKELFKNNCIIQTSERLLVDKNQCLDKFIK